MALGNWKIESDNHEFEKPCEARIITLQDMAENRGMKLKTENSINIRMFLVRMKNFVTTRNLCFPVQHLALIKGPFVKLEMEKRKIAVTRMHTQKVTQFTQTRRGEALVRKCPAYVEQKFFTNVLNFLGSSVCASKKYFFFAAHKRPGVP